MTEILHIQRIDEWYLLPVQCGTNRISYPSAYVEHDGKILRIVLVDEGYDILSDLTIVREFPNLIYLITILSLE